MKIFLIVATVILFYGTFSTWFADTDLAGNLGTAIGKGNVAFFGYFAYADMVLLLVALYVLYFKKALRKSLDFYLGWLLFYIAVVMLQAMLLSPTQAGFAGTTIVDFLLPYIGKGGVWLFWVMIVALIGSFVWDSGALARMRFKPNRLWRRKEKRATVSFETIEKERDMLRRKSANVKKSLSRLKKNPFASPRLEEELPVATASEAPRSSTRKRTAKGAKRERTEQREHAMSLSVASSEEETVTAPYEAPAENSEAASDTSTRSHTAQETVSGEPAPSAASVAHSSHVPIVEELEENAKLLKDIETGTVEKPINFTLPSIDFLQKPPRQKKRVNEAEIDLKSGLLLEKLKLFNINGDIVRTYTGPLVTTFEFKPAPNVKVSKILNLQDDLAMALSAETIRIQAPIPGRDVVGIEIPNDERETIYLREILESEIFQSAKSPLTVALGKDIVGNPFLTDIQKLPHLLIAGTTGSGKSVGINAMILSLLYKNDPNHLKLMMIDPKMLEFSIYDDIPHLITPVITEPKQAIAALANMVGEMDRRYKLMAKMRTKTIDNYNEKVKRTGEGEPMPFIVVIIDELADLMMNGGKEVETSIARLAQKSRACGIHLIVATQRPSVDVVTGIIKANLPSRLSYRVGQKIDSKVILDSLGAESLLGRGDGLFTPPGTNGLVRIHAPWATEEEIETVVEFIKAQRAPEYDESYLIEGGGVSGGGQGGEEGIDLDPLYEDAKQVVLNDKKTSISYLQRKLQIGYNRAANLIEQLEATGVLSAPNAKGNREILL